MSETQSAPRGVENGVITFHFDVAEHSISQEQLILTLKSTEKILRNFNRFGFNNKFDIQIRIITPQEGGVIINICVAVNIAAAIFTIAHSAVEIASSSYVEAVSTEIYGSTPTELTIDYIRKMRQDYEEKQTPETASKCLSDATTRFMETPPGTLEKSGFKKTPFRDAYLAKDAILQSCLDNPEVKGLGFDSSDKFKISRDDFEKYMMYPRRKSRMNVKEQKWVVEPVEIKITALVEGELPEWSGKAGHLGEIDFSMRDKKYLNYASSSRGKAPRLGDKMHVQLAYREDKRKPYDFYVVKVLHINKRRIGNRYGTKSLKRELIKILDDDYEMPEYEARIIEPTQNKEKQVIHVTWKE